MIFYLFASFLPFFLFAVFIYLIFSNRSISRRLRILEEKMKGGAPVLSPNSTANVPPTVPQNLVQNIPQVAPQAAPVSNNNIFSPGPATEDKLAAWLKEDWLMKLGALLFIVGFGWFVSYAFANNWIGPIGRISLGVAGGALIMILGFWRMAKYPSQGAVFMSLGAGMAILTVFAGRSIYGFFTPESALGFDFIIIAFVAFASYKFNVKALAQISQVLAFVTPLLSAGQTDSMFLFSYLFLVSLATLFLAGLTGWRDLIASSLIFVGLYSAPYIMAGNDIFYTRSIYALNAPLILIFAYVFGMLYLFAGMAAVVNKGVQNVKNEITLALCNGLFLFLWIYNVAPKEWSSLIFVFWAVVFAVSSFVAFQMSAKLAPFYAYGSVAATFIAAATAAELNGASLTIAFTLEVFLLVLTVLALTKNTRAAISTGFLFAVPIMLSLTSAANYANSTELFTKDFSVLALLAGTLIFAGRMITSAASGEQKESENNSGSVFVVTGTLYIGYIIWQVMHIVMVPEDMATMATLIIYTLFGLGAYFAGLYGNDMARRTYGAALIAFVVARLVFVDVWHMELFGRVVTFGAIGVILMSTAFLTKKKKHEITQ